MTRRRIDPESRQRAQQIYRDLARRFRETCPEWALAPETPASVLLEIWAELAADYEREVGGLEDRLLRRFLEAIEVEPRGPRPARGLVKFEGEKGDVARRIGSGTLLTYARHAGSHDDAPCVFETVDDCWVGGGRVRRAFSMTASDFRILPIADSLDDTVAPATPFGAVGSPERFIFLGDPRLTELRRAGIGVRIEWKGASLILADLRWEYRAATGWRGFEPGFEMVRDSGEPYLRMTVGGPLFDLAEETREEMTLPFPWLRAQLEPRHAFTLALPELIIGDDESGGKVARLFADSSGIVEDLSHGEEKVELQAWSTSGDGTAVLGFDGDGPYTVCFEFAGRSPGGDSAELWRWNPRPPKLEWEYFDGREWLAFAANEIEDRSADFQRSAGVHIVPTQSAWTARSLFGETLRWLRARWAGGGFVSAPVVARVIPSGVEVVQGVTLYDQPIPRPPDGWVGWIDVPTFPEGVAEPFDGLIVETETREVWRRHSGADGDPDAGAVFRIRRSPEGRLQIQFDTDTPGVEPSVPPPHSSVSIERIRVGLGRGGNLPAGTLDLLQTPVAGVSRVEQVTATRGAEEVESTGPLARRLALQWQGAERAVSAEDYRALALSILPDLLRVDVYRDPDRPGGVLVVVVGPAVNPARCEALARYLADRGVAGVAVRVRQGSSLPAMIEVEITGLADSIDDEALVASPDELERWFAGTLRDLYGEVPGTSSGSGPCVVIPLVDLRDESIKNLLSRELRGRREVRGLDLEVSDISVHVEGVDSTEWSRGRPNVDVTPGDYLEVRRVRVRAAGSEIRGVRSDETEPGVD